MAVKMELFKRKEIRKVVGLMSGTSVDGIDAALVEITGDPYDGKVNLLEFENKPFPEEIRAKIFDLFDTGHAAVDKVGYMNVLLGELYAQAAVSVVKKAGLEMAEIDCIGSHGQTIYHHPQICREDGYPIRYTVQIGEGAVIANRTGIPCVSDFRVADMAAGGQGAPLVPFTEYLLYRSDSKTILLQNIGGIGNITVLPADCGAGEVYAFDTGPGNMIIDGLMSRFTGGKKKMDEGGRIAAGGKIHTSLLKELCSHDYFNEKPPKSTGRELFGDTYINRLYDTIHDYNISLEDAMATVTDFTAWAIEDSYQRYILPHHPADQLLIGGGGSYNGILVDRIRKRLNQYNVEVLLQEDLGFNSDAKEAIAFALLADCTMQGRCNTIPSVTGANRPVVMGKISL
ncbi:anhydro-N-acetylmuramic acid kinase [Anaerocolumna xylanovorans]|uniref:Anhydro-N-acetylmuramic acid kinase n=1 Tax=Anaerocolumna xylanovorans DSM 12503 TaxID=1121345 RepID=A0A1M7XYC0_9FIRM|nr:anhydro-N-acetylmuramic acid kinase [Anaerocolumna xylanovorans]SHO43983.1 anhydro-N-acetylmuramic acid kinase [Anaerocolumna xylanovorans DSM 12503]